MACLVKEVGVLTSKMHLVPLPLAIRLPIACSVSAAPPFATSAAVAPPPLLLVLLLACFAAVLVEPAWVVPPPLAAHELRHLRTQPRSQRRIGVGLGLGNLASTASVAAFAFATGGGGGDVQHRPQLDLQVMILSQPDHARNRSPRFFYYQRWMLRCCGCVPCLVLLGDFTAS